MIRNQAKSSFLPAILALTLSEATLAFDVAGLRINDSVDDFQNLVGPAKEYLTVTHDPEGKIVRIFYRQEGLPNDPQTQAKVVNRICDKYGYVTSCSVAISEINSKEKNNKYEYKVYEFALKSASNTTTTVT